MENVKKHTDIKLVITEERRNNLASEPDIHNKHVYFDLSILEISKTVIYLKIYLIVKLIKYFLQRIRICNDFFFVFQRNNPSISTINISL